MTSILERPQRANVSNAEWQISAELVRDGVVLERSSAPLRITDAQLNGKDTFKNNAINIGRWIDELAQKRARDEAAQSKHAKSKKGNR